MFGAEEHDADPAEVKQFDLVIVVPVNLYDSDLEDRTVHMLAGSPPLTTLPRSVLERIGYLYFSGWKNLTLSLAGRKKNTTDGQTQHTTL